MLKDLCFHLGQVVHPPILMGNVIHSSSAPPGPRSNFPNPIQRPELGVTNTSLGVVQGQQGLTGQVSTAASLRNSSMSSTTVSNPTIQPRPQQPGSGPQSFIKAQQAKQRQDLLAHAASFLNPFNRPSQKNAMASATTSTPGSTGPMGMTTPSAPKTDGSGDGKKSAVLPALAKPPPASISINTGVTPVVSVANSGQSGSANSKADDNIAAQNLNIKS